MSAAIKLDVITLQNCRSRRQYSAKNGQTQWGDLGLFDRIDTYNHLYNRLSQKLKVMRQQGNS